MSKNPKILSIYSLNASWKDFVYGRVDEYKQLGCQSDKTRCSWDSTWGPLDCEAKTLPIDQQVKHMYIAKLKSIILCSEICPVIERFFIFSQFF